MSHIFDGIQTPPLGKYEERRGPASLVESFLLLCVLGWLECTVFCARLLKILESCLVASFLDEIDPISVSEIASSITLESDDELWTHEFPTNCPICLSLSREFSYRTSSLTNFKAWFPLVPMTEFIGG